MATAKTILVDGLKIGDVVHKKAELRNYTAAEMIEACEAAEKVVETAYGPTLVASPTLVDAELLCRQIVRIGDHSGPLTMKELGKLSGVDLALLREEVKKLHTATLADAIKRGRDPGRQGDG